MTTENEEKPSPIALHGTEAPEAAKPIGQVPEAYIAFPNEESFKTRMERHTRSTLKKEFGVESPDELKLKFSKLAELEAREEEQRKASMTREQQLTEEIETMKKTMSEAMTRAERSEFEARTTKLFSKLGIKQSDYATYRLQSAEKGEGFNEESYFQALLEDPRERIALGVDDITQAAQAPRQVTMGATTTSLDNLSAPKPARAGAAEPIKSAFDLDDAAYKKRRQQYGLG